MIINHLFLVFHQNVLSDAMMKDLRDGDDETNIDIGNKISLRAGFEPALENPIGFRVQRLNHSAITAAWHSSPQMRDVS